MIGIILAMLTLVVFWNIFSAINDSITQQHLDMDRTFYNSLRRAEQLAYIWFYEIKPDEYRITELICFKTPCGQYWDGLPMACIPVIVPLTGRPQTRRNYLTGKEETVKYRYKKEIQANYLKKYHTSCDLFFKFQCMFDRKENVTTPVGFLKCFENEFHLSFDKPVY